MIMTAPVRNQITNGTDLEIMDVCKLEKVIEPSHRPIIIHDLADHARWIKSGKARDVDGRLRVSRSNQHTARSRDKRENVPRRDNMLGPLRTIDRHRYGPGAVDSGTACSATFLQNRKSNR